MSFNCDSTLHIFLRELPSFGINPEIDFSEPTTCTLYRTTDWKLYKPMYVGLSNKDKINICYEVAAIKKFCDKNNIDPLFELAKLFKEDDPTVAYAYYQKLNQINLDKALEIKDLFEK